MDTFTAPLFSAADFRARAARQRGPFDGADYGDHTWNPGMRHLFVRDKLHDAAVLVPVIDHGDAASVLLTTRNSNLRSHSGQIAFPGGRIDPTDASPEAAALREAEEEVGLDASFIDVVGRLPDYVSGSGYRITPVLSVVRPNFLLTINRDEVDDAFEVPLSFLMDPANHRRDSRIWESKERFFYTMPFGERYIWGVTAGILRALYERLYA